MMQLPSIIRSIYVTPPHDNNRSHLSPSSSPTPQKKLLNASPGLQRANTFSRFRTSSMRTHHRAKSDTSPSAVRKALTPESSPKPVRKAFSLRRKKSKREEGKEPRVYVTPSFKKKLPLKKSMFGATLEEVMELQKDSHPTHHLPWVLTLLADKIIEFNGLEMEGIFRVPGDIDEVNALRVALDSGDHVKNFGTQDPSVCASLLKEWLRDLYDPIIPETLYNQCIEYCDHPQWTPNVIKDLPDIHRLVVTYIIRFLQKFAEKENIPKTKMTQDNLAMVFAPNLLRCPSDDPQVIYENTLKQMTFVKTLIVNLDTSYMDGVI